MSLVNAKQLTANISALLNGQCESQRDTLRVITYSVQSERMQISQLPIKAYLIYEFKWYSGFAMCILFPLLELSPLSPSRLKIPHATIGSVVVPNQVLVR